MRLFKATFAHKNENLREILNKNLRDIERLLVGSSSSKSAVSSG